MKPQTKSRLKWADAYAESRGGKAELIGCKAKKQLAAFGKPYQLPRLSRNGSKKLRRVEGAR